MKFIDFKRPVLRKGLAPILMPKGARIVCISTTFVLLIFRKSRSRVALGPSVSIIRGDKSRYNIKQIKKFLGRGMTYGEKVDMYVHMSYVDRPASSYRQREWARINWQVLIIVTAHLSVQVLDPRERIKARLERQRSRGPSI